MDVAWVEEMMDRLDGQICVCLDPYIFTQGLHILKKLMDCQMMEKVNVFIEKYDQTIGRAFCLVETSAAKAAI
jgi:hypothetical protein